MGLVQIGEFGGAGQHFLAPGDILFAHRPRRRDLALDQALLEGSEHAAGLLDFLKQRPRRFAELLRQALDAAGAGRRIGHFGEVGFFQQHQLRVARHAPRERIGQSERQRMRQHGDGVGAAEPCGECRDRRAQHVHVGVALRQHPPCGIGGDEDRLGREPAGLFDPRPQQPQARGILPASGIRRHRRKAAHRPCLAHPRAPRRRPPARADRRRLTPARTPAPALPIRRHRGSPVHRRPRTDP